MAKFKKILPHIAIATIFFILSLTQQYFFYWFKNLPIVFLTFEKYSLIFFFIFILSFIKNELGRFMALSFYLWLNFFQMSHLSYFGTQILPTEIWLLFTQYTELGGTLKEELLHIIFPFALTVLPLLLGSHFQKKIPAQLKTNIILFLFIGYLLYNPIRTFVTGNTWGRQPSTRELSGMNVYLSASYFLGRILPNKLANKRNDSQNSSTQLIVVNKQNPRWDKIIIILGESLSANHMQSFGYKKETTPYLMTLKNKDHFFSTIGLSSGVSTDISVAFFLNMSFGDAGGIKSSTGTHCLFKMAKSQGFETSFISNQSSQQLRYIIPYLCSSSTDHLSYLEDIAPHEENHDKASDDNLLAPLENILMKKNPQFVILNQRGSHAPWNVRYSVNSSRFVAEGADKRIADYDNSVVEFDSFWKKLDILISKHKEKILLIYLSDHGEVLGEDGKWGHGFIHPKAFEIPIMMQSFNQTLPNVLSKLPPYLPQYNLSLIILNELGLETNQKPEIYPTDYMIYGNDIDGLAGKAKIEFLPNKTYRFESYYE